GLTVGIRLPPPPPGRHSERSSSGGSTRSAALVRPQPAQLLLGRRQLRSPTHAMLRLSHSTCRTLSDSRARSTSPHRKTALMARSLGFLLPLVRPFRTPGPRFQAPCQNRRHLSPPRQGAHHAEALRGKFLVRWRLL